MPLTLSWCSRIDDDTKRFVLFYQTRGCRDLQTVWIFIIIIIIIMNTWSLHVAYLWFEVFIAALQKNQIFSDVTLCCGIVVRSIFNAHGSFWNVKKYNPINPRLESYSYCFIYKTCTVRLISLCGTFKNCNLFLFVAFNHSQDVLVYFLCSSFNIRPLL